MKKKYYEVLKYNELFYKTGNNNILNGYLSENYKVIRDYKAIGTLLRKISFSSICDLGCGTGILLKFIREELGEHIIPYGFEYNPIAIELLKTEVLPGFASNFICTDINLITILPRVDVVIAMLGSDYQKHLLKLLQGVPYIIFRLAKEKKNFNLQEKFIKSVRAFDFIDESSYSPYHIYRLIGNHL